MRQFTPLLGLALSVCWLCVIWSPAPAECQNPLSGLMSPSGGAGGLLGSLASPNGPMATFGKFLGGGPGAGPGAKAVEKGKKKSKKLVDDEKSAEDSEDKDPLPETDDDEDGDKDSDSGERKR